MCFKTLYLNTEPDDVQDDEEAGDGEGNLILNTHNLMLPVLLIAFIICH